MDEKRYQLLNAVQLMSRFALTGVPMLWCGLSTFVLGLAFLVGQESLFTVLLFLGITVASGYFFFQTFNLPMDITVREDLLAVRSLNGETVIPMRKVIAIRKHLERGDIPWIYLDYQRGGVERSFRIPPYRIDMHDLIATVREVNPRVLVSGFRL